MVPNAIAGFTGVTATETSDAGFTVRVLEPDTLPVAAVISVEPEARDVARPLEPAALLMVATDVFEDVQVAAAVRFCVEPSE